MIRCVFVRKNMPGILQMECVNHWTAHHVSEHLIHFFGTIKLLDDGLHCKFNFSFLARPTCDNMKCGLNEVCAGCGQTPCNTYDCDNPDGKGKACPAICFDKPACVCLPNFARETPNGPCKPLNCPCTTPIPPSKWKFHRFFFSRINANA